LVTLPNIAGLDRVLGSFVIQLYSGEHMPSVDRALALALITFDQLEKASIENRPRLK